MKKQIAFLTFVAALTACSSEANSSGHSTPPPNIPHTQLTVPNDNEVTLKPVRLPNGHTIDCLVWTGGGISCDWNEHQK